MPKHLQQIIYWEFILRRLARVSGPVPKGRPQPLKKKGTPQ